VEILLALIYGAAYGLVLHYLMAGRVSRGAALAPLLGAALGGVTWLVLTWAGVATTNPWIWVVSIVVPTMVVPVVLIALTRTREAHDARERVRLKIV